ncbi:MAG: hypothetical protein HN377_07665 [Alphaproteobacteria bacterium]|jgi:hypothetical protein|nr:hypothetical protein [Alphaproteobacteria bacterium]MBT7941911.1 hypothetical protein [Alphaproteobacteria bacterium]
MFKCCCEDAQAHPQIAEFVKFVENLTNGETLDFTHVSSLPFMAYWKSLCIIEFVPEKNDFRFRLWGTELAEIFERDQTGKMMCDIYPEERYKTLHELHTDALNDMETICASGNLDWMDREHAKWHQVTMPMMRNGKITETLSYLLFE